MSESRPMNYSIGKITAFSPGLPPCHDAFIHCPSASDIICEPMDVSTDIEHADRQNQSRSRFSFESVAARSAKYRQTSMASAQSLSLP
jgi:hypothetical protein